MINQYIDCLCNQSTNIVNGKTHSCCTKKYTINSIYNVIPSIKFPSITCPYEIKNAINTATDSDITNTIFVRDVPVCTPYFISRFKLILNHLFSYINDNHRHLYDNYNIPQLCYNKHRLTDLNEEFGEIVTLREHTISLYPRLYTPTNSSRMCNATPPTINKAHKSIGIADIPNMPVIADSPIQPKTPNTIIMLGGVLATTLANNLANIFSAHLLLHSLPQKNEISLKNKLQKDTSNNLAGKLLFYLPYLLHIPYLTIHPSSEQNPSCICISSPHCRSNNGLTTNYTLTKFHSNYPSIFPYMDMLFIYLSISYIICYIIIIIFILYITILTKWETTSLKEKARTIYSTFSYRLVSQYLSQQEVYI